MNGQVFIPQHMNGSWEKRFETWWRHTPVTQMNLASRRISGTIADVYTSVHDGKNTYAVKTVSSDSNKIMHDNIMLFSEYHIHNMVQNLYIKENRFSRLVRLHWIKKISLRGNVVVAFAMDRLRETWYNRTRVGYLPTAWKQEALTELNHWNRAWGFFHRDPHLNNVGILPNDTWCFFDLSMSCFSNGLSVFNKEAFYDSSDNMTFHLDPAILNASWCQYQNDSSWALVQRAWKSSKAEVWKSRTPVIIENCIFAKKGRFTRIEDNQIVVEVRISKRFVDSHNEEICVIRGIPTYFTFVSQNDRVITILIRLERRDVKPDVHHQHIAYYLYEI